MVNFQNKDRENKDIRKSNYQNPGQTNQPGQSAPQGQQNLRDKDARKFQGGAGRDEDDRNERCESCGKKKSKCNCG